jgi:hypothetical protein
MFASMNLWANGDTLSVAERNARMGFNDTIDRLAPDFVQVSLVVADPGEVLYSILGHAALRMQCPIFGLDYVFSYESEEVRGRVLRFLMNDLKMGMMSLSTEEFLEPYREEGRGVKEYRLNLSPESETELWRILDEKVEEGMNLSYDYIQRGCATSCRKLVESVVHIQYAPATLQDPRTMREQFYDCAPKGWALFECMTLVGGQVDNPHLPAIERLIAPAELARAWQNATVDGRLLIDTEPTDLVVPLKTKGNDVFPPLYASIVLLLLSMVGFFWHRPYIDCFLLAVQTLLGVLMVWLLVSPLPGSEWSWLIVVFNPLPALCWKWRKYWALPYAILIVLWCVAMLCAPHRLVEYAHVLLALSFALVVLKQSPVLHSLNSKKHNFSIFI